MSNPRDEHRKAIVFGNVITRMRLHDFAPSLDRHPLLPATLPVLGESRSPLRVAFSYGQPHLILPSVYEWAK